MYSYSNPTWQRIKRRIAERTGLKSEDEIEVYSEFCHHADSEDGVVMYGDVQHEFYTYLLNKSPQTRKESERKFYESYANDLNRDDKMPQSPLSLEAQRMYEDYLKRFIERGLVLAPISVGCSKDKYPILRGYNFFNDPEFYKKTIKENSRSFELINPWEGVPCPESPGIEDMLN